MGLINKLFKTDKNYKEKSNVVSLTYLEKEFREDEIISTFNKIYDPLGSVYITKKIVEKGLVELTFEEKDMVLPVSLSSNTPVARLLEIIFGY